MDKNSKILIWVFFGLILVSAVATYWRTMVTHAYPVVEDAATQGE